jgi:DNA modification methylase
MCRDIATLLLNGLRAYSGLPDSVWDGDPNCAHSFGDEQMAERRPYSAEFANGIAPSSEGAAKFQGATVSQGAFCRCGAWRGQLGLESTISAYVRHVVEVFGEIKRVLRDDGVAFCNIGDSFFSNPAKGGSGTFNGRNGRGEGYDRRFREVSADDGLKPKDLCLIPFRLALALQADGWWIRSDVIWNKPATMPESVEDRPTRAHEYVLLLTKSAKYYYDADAIREAGSANSHGSPNINPGWKQQTINAPHGSLGRWMAQDALNGRNKRDVWTIAAEPNRWALCRSCRYVSERWPECRLCGGAGSLAVRQAAADEAGWNPSGPNSRFHKSFDPAHPAKADGKERRDEAEAAECPRCGGKRLCPRCGGRDVTGHFAAYPSRLVELCILAGTSERGECSRCGKNWVRVTERGERAIIPRYPSEVKLRETKMHGPCSWDTAISTGWRPQCACDAPTRPNIVLDPFLGSGTTLETAQRLGRKCVGLELSDDYIAIARKRTEQGSLFTQPRQVADDVPSPNLGQVSENLVEVDEAAEPMAAPWRQMNLFGEGSDGI